MADNVAITAGAGTTIATDDVSTVHYQRVKLVDGTLDSTTAIASGGGVEAGALRVTVASDSTGILSVDGTVAHDGVDANAPVKIGMRAIAHGTNPTAVAAADRTDWYANRAGVPFVIGGHPKIVTTRVAATTAVTNAAIVTIATGLKIVVTRITVTLDSASTVFPSVSIGFGTASVPTGDGNLAYHGGVPAGGGFTIGDGSGILGVGADDEDLRWTTVGNATGNGIAAIISYYTIES